MQRHLDTLVSVLVMHVVDAVEGVHVGAGKPVHESVKLLQDVLVHQHVPGNSVRGRGNLNTRDFILATIDGVEEGLRQVDARAKELHLLADLHGRNTAGNPSVIAPRLAHQGVRFVLNRGSLD